jgi:hypothetical protein
MVELSELEKEYEYTIEFDDQSEYIHFYFADIIDFESPAYIRFDPTYEVGKDVERKVEGETVMIPYEKVLRIVKRKPV